MKTKIDGGMQRTWDFYLQSTVELLTANIYIFYQSAYYLNSSMQFIPGITNFLVFRLRASLM